MNVIGTDFVLLMLVPSTPPPSLVFQSFSTCNQLVICLFGHSLYPYNV
jgi:hypothetical protein